jgi:hypothetical protein
MIRYRGGSTLVLMRPSYGNWDSFLFVEGALVKLANSLHVIGGPQVNVGDFILGSVVQKMSYLRHSSTWFPLLLPKFHPVGILPLK